MLTCRSISTATKRYPHLRCQLRLRIHPVRFYMSGSCCRVSDRAYRMPRQLPRYVDSARSNCLFGILDPQNSRIALREDGRLYPTAAWETIVVTINIAANFARACLRLIDFRFMALCLAPPRFAKTLQLRNCHRCVRPRSDRIRRFGCLA